MAVTIEDMQVQVHESAAPVSKSDTPPAPEPVNFRGELAKSAERERRLNAD